MLSYGGIISYISYLMYLHSQVFCIHVFYDYLVSKCPDIILRSGFVVLRHSNYALGPQKVSLNATAALVYHLDFSAEGSYSSFIFIKKN